MSTFAVKIEKIRAIEPIPGADNIDVAVVNDYRCVVRKQQHNVGDLVAYIPEAAIVPEWLLKELGLEGKLAGSDKNRVKAIKLRGVLSQGLVVPLDIVSQYGYGDNHTIQEGEDVTTLLGIVKYEPPIPVHMSGEIYNAGLENTISFDVENIKAWPDVFQEGEEVCITEKIHGTFCCVGLLPQNRADTKHIMDRFVVFSKGLGTRGLCFKDNEANINNVYLRALRNENIFEKIKHYYDQWCYPIFFLGEVFGKGVQDLNYGNTLSFRVFDICTGERGDLKYMPPLVVQDILDQLKINMVPVLYTGPYSKDLVGMLTSGTETVSGTNSHIREGVVIRPLQERYHNNLGRVILKSVSPEYLIRKGGTEFN